MLSLSSLILFFFLLQLWLNAASSAVEETARLRAHVATLQTRVQQLELEAGRSVSGEIASPVRARSSVGCEASAGSPLLPQSPQRISVELSAAGAQILQFPATLPTEPKNDSELRAELTALCIPLGATSLQPDVSLLASARAVEEIRTLASSLQGATAADAFQLGATHINAALEKSAVRSEWMVALQNLFETGLNKWRNRRLTRPLSNSARYAAGGSH